MRPDFLQYAQALSGLSKSETELAVCILWYLEKIEGETGISVKRVVDVIYEAGLRGRLNASRLGTNLRAHRDVLAEPKTGLLRIKLGSQQRLAAALEPLLTVKPLPAIDDNVIPNASFLGTRRYLEKMVLQINASYQFQLYDGCAVICRRIMESLLIEAFEKQGHANAIKQGNDYAMLSGILSEAGSGKHFRLSRGMIEKMNAIKAVGDTAAHHRSHITTKMDIDHIAIGLRQALSELCNLADIHPKES